MTCARSRARRVLLGVAVAAVGALAVPAGVAFADPPGPTDYRSSVVSIEPSTAAIAVDIVGGDSLVRLRAEPGTEVSILGYYGEPYVRILADGSVQQNRQSPSVAQNETRYGQGSVPAGTASEIAARLPEWEAIGRSGEFLWHDHRAHWMSPEAPPGARPGDVVSDQEIPLLVGGTEVSVRVVTVLQPAPSRVPVAGGAIVAGFTALMLLSSRRRQAWLLAVAGAAAAGVGWWEFRSIPADTGPSSLWVVLPAVAAVSGLLALPLGRTLASHALVLLGGLELAAWVYLRRDGLVRAILPTEAPGWLDRGVTAGAGVAAVVAVLAGGLALFRTPGPVAPEPAARPRAGAAGKPARARSRAPAASVATWGRKRK